MYPNPETLHAVLLSICDNEKLIALCVDGYLPRELDSAVTPLWRIRDVFYRLADTAETQRSSKLPLADILKDELLLPVLRIDGADYIDGWNGNWVADWILVPSVAGDFPWPDYIRHWTPMLSVGYTLYVLYSIWCLDAKLIEVDFSSALTGFTHENRLRLQELIAKSMRTFPVDGDLKKIVDVLRSGSKSGRELEKILGVKRGVLRTRYLVPAIENGLVVTTSVGSSPKQRYKLASERR